MLSTRRSTLAVLAAPLAVLSLVLLGCVPAPPAAISVRAGDSQAQVSFGDFIAASYEVLVMPGERIVSAPKNNHVMITGLANGTPYTFQVRGLSSTGAAGAWSAPSAPVVPAGRPAAPTITRVAGFVDLETGCTARVTFSPGWNGGSAITRYEVTVAGRTTVVSGTSSPIEVPGLLQHTPYDFTVRAVNELGAGPASPSFAGSCS